MLARRTLIGAAAALPFAAPPVATRAQEAGTIKIGAPNSLTGGYGEGGRNVVVGLQIAADEINAAGGIKSLGGAKLAVLPADTTSEDPATAASVTRRLISQDKVSVLVGAHTSTMTLSAQIEAERGEVAILTTSYADQIVQRGYKYTFKVAPQASTLSREGYDDIAALMEAIQHKKIGAAAVFYGADASSQSVGKAYLELLAKQNVKLVASGAFPSNLADPTSVVGPILATKPDVLFFGGFVNDTILITRALRSLGVNIPIVSSGSGMSVKVIGQTLGKQANNLMGTLAWNWDLPLPGVKELNTAYRAKMPNEPYCPQEAGEGYAIGQIIADAAERAKSADPKAIRDALATTNLQTVLPGGAVSFEPNGMRKDAIGILTCWINGELRTVYPRDDATVSPPL